MLPDSKQIRRLILLCSGWFFSRKAGRLRRFLDGGRVIGGRTRKDVMIGYHDCVGHIGTTIIPVALSWYIFLSPRRTQLKGGKIKVFIRP